MAQSVRQPEAGPDEVIREESGEKSNQSVYSPNSKALPLHQLTTGKPCSTARQQKMQGKHVLLKEYSAKLVTLIDPPPLPSSRVNLPVSSHLCPYVRSLKSSNNLNQI